MARLTCVSRNLRNISCYHLLVKHEKTLQKMTRVIKQKTLLCKTSNKTRNKITHESDWSQVVQLNTERFAKLSFFSEKKSTLSHFFMFSLLSKITLRIYMQMYCSISHLSMHAKIFPVKLEASCFKVCQPGRTFMMWCMHDLSFTLYYTSWFFREGKEVMGETHLRYDWLTHNVDYFLEHMAVLSSHAGKLRFVADRLLWKTSSRRSVGWLSAAVYSSLAWWSFVVLFHDFHH